VPLPRAAARAGRQGRAEEAGLLFLAARRFVESLGLAQPTLVAFEDIHWAKPSKLELLEYLARHVQETSTVFIALARPELAARLSWPKTTSCAAGSA
jgi:predicted ATPase